MIPMTYCVRQVHVTFEGARPLNEAGGRGRALDNVLEEATLSTMVHAADAAPRSDRELQPSGTDERPGHRQLALVEVWIHFWSLRINTTYRFRLTINKADGTVFAEEFTFTTISRTHAWIHIRIDDGFLNDDMSGVCETCTFEPEQLDCAGIDDVCDDDVVVKVSAAETCS